jgi:YD repeat-containing protein
VTGYEIFEGDTLVATVAGNVQGYLINSLTTGRGYIFTIQAGNATGAWSTNGPTTSLVAGVPTLSVASPPPLDQTVTGSVASIASFLYAGPHPVQLSLATAIAPLRTVVLQGRTLDNHSNPLPGVAVTVADHPEYGYTVSRSDGHYDLVVNGGGTLTLSFDMAGLLSAERSQRVPWARFVRVEDVALIALDTAVTQVDLSGNVSSVQVARATPTQDSRGTRQATMMIAPGTTAQIALPSGEMQSLTMAHVRATEYTAGANGPAQMPADLPATSAYTYAAALTTDEADAVQASQVLFSQPVAVYLENFLSFKVGAHVPSGYYSTTTHAWIPSVDGRVVQVLSITGGVATVDVDGTGQPATDAELTTLGISTAELSSVGSLYAAGQTLWRVPVKHFTPWDYNQGGDPPPNACAPNQSPSLCSSSSGSGSGSGSGSSSGSSSGSGSGSGSSSGGDNPGPPLPQNPPTSCPDTTQQCIVDIEEQILGEQVAVGGTPFTLNYRSDRTPGYKSQYSLNIPLTGPTVPGPLQAVQLEVDVAGEQFTQTFGPGTNQNYLYTWDGNDGYGRPVNGSQTVSVRLGYTYTRDYTDESEVTANITQYGSQFGHYTYFGAPVTTSGTGPSAQITLWYYWNSTLGGLGQGNQSDGLGGWSLSVHHTYSLVDHSIYFGDGSKRSVDTLPPIVTPIAGQAGQNGLPGDGIPASQALINAPSSVAVGPDGTIYFLDGGTARLRAITPDGIINTVYTFGGLGATVRGPTAIAVGPDGLLYVTTGGGVMRRNSDGTWAQFAGYGYCPDTCADSFGLAGFGTPALGACIPWTITGLAFAPDSSLYLAGAPSSCVIGLPLGVELMRITTDGYLWHVVGQTSSATQPVASATPLGDAYLVGSSLNNYYDPTLYPHVAVGNDGTVYMNDGYEVRSISPQGMFGTIAGNGSETGGGPSADGVSALQAGFLPDVTAVDPSGTVIFVDKSAYNGPRVKAVPPDGLLETIMGNGNFTVPEPTNAQQATTTALDVLGTSLDGIALAPDGTLVIEEQEGYIRRVLPAIQGDPVAGYVIADADGSKVYLFDGSGRHLSTKDALTGTTIYAFAYDGAGHLSSVTDVNGDTTTIGRDGSGNPTLIANAFGQVTTLSVGTDGYLSRIQDAAGSTYSYVYGSTGLLATTTTPRGGQYVYTYDLQGRLLRNVEPNGGGSAYAASSSRTRSRDRRVIA